jgi:hypothetical protein
MEKECGHQPEFKEFTAILKVPCTHCVNPDLRQHVSYMQEVAYSRGSQWYLLGT